MLLTFTIQQIETKINELNNYLSNRKLKVDNDVNSPEDLRKLYDKVNDLNKQITHLHSAFAKSVIDSVDQRKGTVSQKTLSDAKSVNDLIKRTNEMRKLGHELHPKKPLVLLPEVQPSDGQPASTNANPFNKQTEQNVDNNGSVTPTKPQTNPTSVSPINSDNSVTPTANDAAKNNNDPTPF